MLKLQVCTRTSIFSNSGSRSLRAAMPMVVSVLGFVVQWPAYEILYFLASWQCGSHVGGQRIGFCGTVASVRDSVLLFGVMAVRKPR
eukprot:SAG11_NODE_1426_length_4943_cov_7.372419_7_plen_87_part_00